MANFYKLPWIERAVGIQNANGASFWLKDALRATLKRDPVDAYRDAATLADILKARVDETLKEA